MSIRNAGAIAGLLLCTLAALAPAPARAQLNIICSVQVEWCTGAVVAFEAGAAAAAAAAIAGSSSPAAIDACAADTKPDAWALSADDCCTFCTIGAGSSLRTTCTCITYRTKSWATPFISAPNIS